MDVSSGIDLLPDGPVRRLVAATSRRDVTQMVSQFAPDYENVTPAHPRRGFRGAAQVGKNWSALFGGLRDLELTVHDATTGPDGRVWMEWSTAGTRADGSISAATGVVIFTVRGDSIASARFYVEPIEQHSGDVDDAIRVAVRGVDPGEAP